MRVLLSLVLLIAIVSSTSAAKPFLCYWEYWGVYREAPYQSTIDKIPVNLCTHVIYSFVGLNETTNKVESLDGIKIESDFRELRALKQKNSALKVMVAIGGWSEGAAKFSRMASNTESIDTFVASVVAFVDKYELDGCDLHWIFPGEVEVGGSAEDKINLVILLQKLRAGLTNKILTVAVAGARYRLDRGYDVPKIAENVDFINVLSFDLRGHWDMITGNHAGLLGGRSSVSETMLAYHRAGAPKEKLIMGIGFYGKSFTLKNPENNGIGVPASAGKAGEVSQAEGTLFYFEICDRLRNRGWTRVFDSASKSPYAFKDDQWVGYEDVEGIKEKTDLINEEGYAGAMVWAIGFDDQAGVCEGGKSPLAHAVARGLAGKSNDDESSTTTAEPQPEPTPESQSKPVFCYWEYWSVYRPLPYRGTIDKIPVDLCTHVVYSFVGLDENNNTVIPLDDIKIDSDLSELRALKNKNPALKVLVAIGGWTEGGRKSSQMASKESTIDTFVASVVEFLEKYELDGYNLQWTFPGATELGGNIADRTNLISLLRKLRSALSGKLSVISVAGPQYRIDEGYDVPNIVENVDFINVMSYDLRGPWDKVTGNHVGLYGGQTSVSQIMQTWHRAGAPKEKLLMGIAFHGKTFTLNNPENHGLNAPATDGEAGEISRETGTLYYYEICDRINRRGWTRVFDGASKSPYAFGGNQWVGYEDVEGIEHKTDLINKENYAGAMVWAIGFDDQSGDCGEGKFPLANAVSRGLAKITEQTDVGSDETPQPTTTIATPSPEPSPGPPPKPFLCYWESYGKYREAPYQGTIDRIPVDLCTHVIYSFVGLDEDTNSVKSLDGPEMDSDLKELRALKNMNPAIKISVAIGGWNEGAAKFSRMASSVTSIDRFVASVATLVEKYELDGCDLHWKFPGAIDLEASPADKENLITLLKKLRSALTGKLLTIAVAGPQYRIEAGYDVPKIVENVDFINVLSLDLRGDWDTVTGNHVGLYGGQTSVSGVMQAWHEAGAPKEKLLMGIAFYGKSFTLKDPGSNGPGVSATIGQEGEISQEPGTLYFYEICDRINEHGWKRVFDNATKSPYAFKGKQWVGYEDVEGIRHKTDLINEVGYAGVVVWAIGLDDQSGACGGGKFPLANAVAQGLAGKLDGTDRNSDEESQPSSTTTESVPEPSTSPEPNTSPESTTSPEPSTSPEPTTSPEPSTSSEPSTSPEPTTPECDSAEQLIPHTSLCSKYIHCVFGRRIEMRCADDLIFDNSRKVCNWPFAVDEKLPVGCPDPLG